MDGYKRYSRLIERKYTLRRQGGGGEKGKVGVCVCGGREQLAPLLDEEEWMGAYIVGGVDGIGYQEGKETVGA